MLNFSTLGGSGNANLFNVWSASVHSHSWNITLQGSHIRAGAVYSHSRVFFELSFLSPKHYNFPHPINSPLLFSYFLLISWSLALCSLRITQFLKEKTGGKCWTHFAAPPFSQTFRALKSLFLLTGKNFYFHLFNILQFLQVLLSLCFLAVALWLAPQLSILSQKLADIPREKN